MVTQQRFNLMAWTFLIVLATGCGSSGGESAETSVKDEGSPTSEATTTTAPPIDLAFRILYDSPTGMAVDGIFMNSRADGELCGVVPRESFLYDSSDRYANLGPDSQMVLRDGSGTIVGTATLGNGSTVVYGEKAWKCEWSLTVPAVGPADFYQVEIAGMDLGVIKHDGSSPTEITLP